MAKIRIVIYAQYKWIVDIFCENLFFFKSTQLGLTLAINRDGSSGGCVRLAVITKDGIDRKVVLHNDLPKFYEG